MTHPNRTSRSWLTAIGIGLAISALTAVASIIAQKIGVSPLPKPLALAFAKTLLGDWVPLPLGLAFHTLYVTFWSVVFVHFFPKRTFMTALGLGLALWLAVLVVFFPIVGWGLAGLKISPMLILASLMPHLLFAVLLWAFERLAEKKDNNPRTP